MKYTCDKCQVDWSAAEIAGAALMHGLLKGACCPACGGKVKEKKE